MATMYQESVEPIMYASDQDSGLNSEKVCTYFVSIELLLTIILFFSKMELETEKHAACFDI